MHLSLQLRPDFYILQSVPSLREGILFSVKLIISSGFWHVHNCSFSFPFLDSPEWELCQKFKDFDKTCSSQMIFKVFIWPQSFTLGSLRWLECFPKWYIVFWNSCILVCVKLYCSYHCNMWVLSHQQLMARAINCHSMTSLLILIKTCDTDYVNQTILAHKGLKRYVVFLHVKY